MSEDLLPGQWLYLREFILCVVGVHGKDLLTGRRTEDFDYFHQLVNSTLSWEDGLTKHKLCDNTAYRPNVDVSAIL